MNQLRPLTSAEIALLEGHGCTSNDWTLISVGEAFSPKSIFETSFSGKIEMGVFENEFLLSGGATKHAGISHSTLHNCILGDNILIERSYIANYTIGSNTLIRNVSELFVEGNSSFGNGCQVSVLNETGGREVTIYDQLSAQNAYFQTFYRHRPILIERLKTLIGNYSSSVASNQGTIGANCNISNCGTLKNIRIGDAATLMGVARLENGSINSTSETPIHIGEGVIAKNFIICAGSSVESGTTITNSFVGQAVYLSNYFSAVDSLFFIFCQGEQGEACAIFAGPFTVTHHKSTLLIGGYYSFMNAGSGTNQSNHHYRLGPSHHGIMERGCKTASDSYILWPSRVGAFSMVLGRHKNHADTSDLPFSYLVDNSGETFIIPAATLRNVGTIRDAHKWITRDTLKTAHRLDCINSNLFTPYTGQKISRAIAVLCNLQDKQGLSAEVYNYQGVKINRASLRKGLDLYRIALTNYLGEKLMQKIDAANCTSFMELIQELLPQNSSGVDKWIDISGLITPQRKIEELINRIEISELTTVSQIEFEFDLLHLQFEECEWSWVVDQLETSIGAKLSDWTALNYNYFIQEYLLATQAFHQNLMEDAHKEFATIMHTGSGIDGNEATQTADFEAVRGKFENHPMVQKLMDDLDHKKKISEQVISKLSKLTN